MVPQALPTGMRGSDVGHGHSRSRYGGPGAIYRFAASRCNRLTADDVVVDIEYSGISTGTERLLWTGRMPAFPGMGYPLVPGYESVGRVVGCGRERQGADRRALSLCPVRPASRMRAACSAARRGG